MQADIGLLKEAKTWGSSLKCVDKLPASGFGENA